VYHTRVSQRKMLL